MDRETVLLRLTTSFSKGETAKTAISRRNRREFPRRCRKGENDAIRENGEQRRGDETAARPSSCMTDYNGPSNACDHFSAHVRSNQVLLQGLLNKVILEVDMFTSSMLNWILANFFVPKSSLKMIISAKFLNINS
ncbi:LOW QUALITY PROTEIN: hypothetical protein V1477_010176 [Vespula maculifrons]|uniref:Uncharacterized protein n=1 Tax=Vespula maculifrons TaxID=7453 RepID=A0ABD2C8G2_VESMC